MKRLLLIVTAAILVSTPAYAQDSYAIRNVSVITMREEATLPDQTVVVEKGLIKSITPSAKTKLAKGIKVIDGTGKFLMPGLFDMHTHFFYEQGDHINTNETELKLMLANGITTARIMAGHPSYLEAKANVKNGTWIGPELSVASRSSSASGSGQQNSKTSKWLLPKQKQMKPSLLSNSRVMMQSRSPL